MSERRLGFICLHRGVRTLASAAASASGICVLVLQAKEAHSERWASHLTSLSTHLLGEGCGLGVYAAASNPNGTAAKETEAQGRRALRRKRNIKLGPALQIETVGHRALRECFSSTHQQPETEYKREHAEVVGRDEAAGDGLRPSVKHSREAHEHDA